jgi:hypothetical protein
MSGEPTQPTRGAGRPRVQVPAAEPTASRAEPLKRRQPRRSDRSAPGTAQPLPTATEFDRAPGTGFRDCLIYVQPILFVTEPTG